MVHYYWIFSSLNSTNSGLSKLSNKEQMGMNCSEAMKEARQLEMIRPRRCSDSGPHSQHTFPSFLKKSGKTIKCQKSNYVISSKYNIRVRNGHCWTNYILYTVQSIPSYSYASASLFLFPHFCASLMAELAPAAEPFPWLALRSPCPAAGMVRVGRSLQMPR